MARGRSRNNGAGNAGGNGANLGFEAKLWLAADALRNNMDAAEYKHVVLGLIFLKYISDAFEEKHAELDAQHGAGRRPRGPGRVPRREHLLGAAGGPLGASQGAARRSRRSAQLVDDAMAAIERDNPSLKGVLPKDYARPGLDKQRLGQLIDLVGDIGARQPGRPREGHPRPRLRVLPLAVRQRRGQEGRPVLHARRTSSACWSRCSRPTRAASTTRAAARAACSCRARSSSRRTAASIGDISIYGQESNHTTWRLAKMNLAIRGIDAQIAHGDTFHNDQHPDLKADYVLANPPFNDSDWGGERLRDDKRWEYGVPPAGNANFAWVQHFIHHLAPTGVAGFVLANGSMSSNQSGEGEIRKAIVEADLVDCMVALPGQLFYSTQIPVCLWFLARNKKQRPLPRPARRDAVHRRPQARHAGRPRAPRADRRRHRQDRRHLPRLARRQETRASTRTCRASAKRRRSTRSASTATC